MRIASVALLLLAGLAWTVPAGADSVTTTTSGADGMVVVNGKPCRVVTRHDGGTIPEWRPMRSPLQLQSQQE